jgi:putative ABC transport system permease protein
MREDLVSALRSLRKSPSFTAVALTVLGLGIGAGSAIFSVVDAVVLRGLPFDEHDRIMAVLEHDTTRETTFGSGSITPQTYLDWRRMQDSFSSLAAVASTSFRLRTTGGEPADARGQRVTSEFFPTLRVPPALGRLFTTEDETEGRHRVVLLSDGFWQRRFGGDAGVIGRTIDLDETPYEIVGVLPPGFLYPVASDKPADVFVPAMFNADDRVRGGNRNYNWLAIARLRDGVGADAAATQMNVIAEGLDREYPKWGPGRRVQVVPLQEHLVGRVRGWMLMLLGAVALVLLIACTNVANLLLARAAGRRREIGIRAALGARRARLIRGLLVEGLVLAFASAAIGVALAYGGVELIRAWLPNGLPRVADIGLDLRVLAVTTLVAGVTGLAFSLVPALQSSRPDLTTTLKDSGRSTTAGAASQRLRSILVVVETALAVVLVVGAGLFVGSFVKLMQVEPGFDYHGVLAINVSPRIDFSGKVDWEKASEQGRSYIKQMLEAVSSVPGVEQAASVSGGLPLTGSWSRTGVRKPGEPKGDYEDTMSLDWRTVTPGYLELMRIPLRSGRTITPDDRDGGDRVIVLNETAARKYFPDSDAIGQRLVINDKEWRVVGIVGDIRHLGPEKPARQEGYVPLEQNSQISGALVMRTAGDPLAVLPAVKAAIWSVNGEQRIRGDAFTLDGFMDRLIAQRRFNMALLSLFGVLGLTIAAVGIYGVMAYLVTQRTSEIGVRMALGASRRHVLGLVLGRAGWLLGLGLAIGSAVSWLLAATVKSFLFEIEPTSLPVFGAALAILAGAGLLASLVPARRAASVDPLVALRHD